MHTMYFDQAHPLSLRLSPLRSISHLLPTSGFFKNNLISPVIVAHMPVGVRSSPAVP